MSFQFAMNPDNIHYLIRDEYTKFDAKI